MCGAEGVVSAFGAAWKSGWPVLHPEPVHLRAPAGEDLVRVCLVTDVPDDPVMRRVENVMQRDRELDRAEVRRQMAARLGNRRDEERPQLARQFRKLGAVEPAQRGGIVDLVEAGYMTISGREARSSRPTRRAGAPALRAA